MKKYVASHPTLGSLEVAADADAGKITACVRPGKDLRRFGVGSEMCESGDLRPDGSFTVKLSEKVTVKGQLTEDDQVTGKVVTPGGTISYSGDRTGLVGGAKAVGSFAWKWGKRLALPFGAAYVAYRALTD